MRAVPFYSIVAIFIESYHVLFQVDAHMHKHTQTTVTTASWLTFDYVEVPNHLDFV